VQVTVEYAGCANNAPVQVLGRGSFDAERVELALEVVAAPLTWDPALVCVGGLDPLLIACFGILPEGELVLGRTRVDFADDQGRDVGTTVLAWVVEAGNDAVSVRAQLVEGVLRLEVLEQLTRVAPYTARMLDAGMGSVVLVSSLLFGTNRGSEYSGVATTSAEPVVQTQLGPLAFRIEVREGSRRVETRIDLACT
jgi:hypothetical protein